MIAGEEELYRLSLRKHPFERSIIEVLDLPEVTARRQQERFLILYPVVMDGDLGGFLIRLEEGEYEPARPHYPQQTVDRLLQQGRCQELQGIPNQRGIKALVWKAK